MNVIGTDNIDIWSLSRRKYLRGELLQDYELLRESYAFSHQPELPCSEQIPELISSVRDLVTAVTANVEFRQASPCFETRKQTGILEHAESLLTPDDASAYLRIPKSALNRECRLRTIGYITINRRGDRRFRKEDLDLYLERQKVAVPGSIKIRKHTGKEEGEARHPKEGEKNRRIKQDRNLTDLRKEIQRLWQ